MLSSKGPFIKTAFCFDFDGTITSEEILPLLARELSIYEEIQALTDATIKGIIPFKRSFLLRCRLLSEVPISRVREIVHSVSLNDEIVDFIKNRQHNSFVVTGNLDVWVNQVINEKLGCEVFSSSADVIGDKLGTITHVLNKGVAVKSLRNQFERLVAIGDGMGDIQMFEECDLNIAFGGVHKPIETLIKSAHIVTYSQEGLCKALKMLS